MGLDCWKALEFPRDVAKFCGIFKGEALFSLKFTRLKWQN